MIQFLKKKKNINFFWFVKNITKKEIHESDFNNENWKENEHNFKYKGGYLNGKLERKRKNIVNYNCFYY